MQAARRLLQPIAGKAPKLTTAEDAVSNIQSGSNVFIHSHSSTPTELLEAMCNRVSTGTLSHVTPTHIILQGNIPWTAPEFWDKIRSYCLFIDGSTRNLVKNGKADYVPVFLSDIPRLFDRNVLPVDVALITVSPPDRHGFCSLGVDTDCSQAAVRNAKKIIALLNPSEPRTFGDSQLHSSHIDYMVPTDRLIYAAPDKGGAASEVEATIGKIVAENLVENGATLQLGIGAIPDSTLAAMSNHKDLGVHSELISDGVVDLLKKGVINNTKKTIMPGKVVTSFAFGTRQFYDYMNNNEQFHFGCCGWTNHVDTIRAQHKMTSINSTLEVDLTGQVCSDSLGKTFYSGFGGQVDFAFGAGTASDGLGRSIIVVPSRTNKGKSRIVPELSNGAGVVTTRGHVQYIVSEYGIASLWGKSVRQRARALIDIAHPDDREVLEKQAFKRLGCMPSK